LPVSVKLPCMTGQPPPLSTFASMSISLWHLPSKYLHDLNWRSRIEIPVV
jgi:hypothetical protein